MRILIANDTGYYHAGSQAVMASIRTVLASQGHVYVGKVTWEDFAQKFKEVDYDALLINGEGTLHHKKSHYWMFRALSKAQKQGKLTYLVNTVWDSNEVSPELRTAIGRLDGLVVREALSARAISSAVETAEPEICPDFSYFAPLDENANFKDFKGSEIRGDWYIKRSREEKAKVAKIFPENLSLKPNKWNWSGLVKSLRTAKLYVTGRHHGVYAACKARTPFIPYVHNCHKIQGLFEWANVSIPIPNNLEEILLARDWAQSNKKEYRRLFDFLERQASWRGID